MSTLLGKKLLNYRIEKLLGQGGMGEVYLGVHTEIGRKVAIKVIAPHLARDPRIQERFKREALILARLNHPNIVQLYDYWARPEEGLYLIMEYVEGISLDRYIHRVLRGPIPPRQAIEIFLQVLDAFQYAHDNGVIHRDIKPSNILLRNDNVVKVLDFGIARIVTPDPTHAEDSALTKTGTTLGTVVYMSPEQLKAKNPAEIDHRSDIYSLGVVLFEMLTGKEMYDRNQLSEFDILVKITSEPPPSLRELAPEIGPDFEPILAKALAKKPEDRYSRCQDFASDLLQILPKYANQEAGTLPRNPALTQTQVSPAEPSFLQRTYARLRASLKDTRSSKRWYLYLSGGILGLTLLGIVAFWFIHYQVQKKEAIELTEKFSRALHDHDLILMEELLAEWLSPFFTDEDIERGTALEKYYRSFWKTLQKDSVAWQVQSSTKVKDTWQVEGLLYQWYVTSPRTVQEPKKVYNRLWGRYETRYEAKTYPSTKVCKQKRLVFFLREGQIQGIKLLDDKPCP